MIRLDGIPHGASQPRAQSKFFQRNVIAWFGQRSIEPCRSLSVNHFFITEFREKRDRGRYLNIGQRIDQLMGLLPAHTLILLGLLTEGKRCKTESFVGFRRSIHQARFL